MDSEEGFEISTVIGDEFVKSNGLPQPSIVKIDVEGQEADTIRGLEGIISHPECRIVYCELHPHKVPEGEKVFTEVTEILERAGFTCQPLSHDSKDMIKGTK